MKFNQQFVRSISVSQVIALALSVVAMLALAPYADAAVINVQLRPLSGDPQLNGTAWSTSVAPMAYTGTGWNGTVLANPTTSASSLIDSDGNLTGVSFVLSGVGNTFNGGSSPLTLLQRGAVLFNPATLTLSGLPTGKYYNLVLASNQTNGRGGVFTINGFASQQTTHTQNTSWANGVNYVEFDGIQPIAGQIVVTFSPINPGGDNFEAFNGFQIEGVTPEPSSIALLGVGGLLAWRRRKNMA